MLIAPFVPWYTFPIPIVVFVFWSPVAILNALTVGPALPATALMAFGTASVLGVLWIVAAVIAFITARRRKWQTALGFTLTNLACGATMLAIFLSATGLGPVEPFGYLSPLAFLGLAALPAAYEISGRWLRELQSVSGPDAERRARSRLLVIGLGYGVVFLSSFVGVAISTAVAIQGLPLPHFYWEEQTIREASAGTFAILGAVSLAAFLPAFHFLLGSRATPRRAA